MAIDYDHAGNIIQIIAALPGFLQKSTIRNKLKEFYCTTEADRHQVIFITLTAIPTIEDTKLSTLVKSWLEVLSEFDGSKISILFRIYCEEIMRNPAVVTRINIDPLIKTFLLLTNKQRQKFVDCLIEVILSSPNKNELLKLLPSSLLEILE
jgi:hypothetical protein